jgi:hypothetical protein
MLLSSSIHWYGFLMKRSPNEEVTSPSGTVFSRRTPAGQMGTQAIRPIILLRSLFYSPAFVTQCPIAANDSFLYTFSTAGQVCSLSHVVFAVVETHKLGWHILVRLVSRKHALYTKTPTLLYRYHSHLCMSLAITSGTVVLTSIQPPSTVMDFAAP